MESISHDEFSVILDLEVISCEVLSQGDAAENALDACTAILWIYCQSWCSGDFHDCSRVVLCTINETHLHSFHFCLLSCKMKSNYNTP